MSTLALNPIFFGKAAVVDQTVKQSLRLRGNVNAALTRAFPTAGNRKTNTMSIWLKRGTLGAGTQIVYGVRNSDTSIAAYMGFTGDALDVSFIGGYRLTSNVLFRDPSAWYHITIAIDTTQATSTERIKIYSGATRVTTFSTFTPPPQNADLDFNAATTHAFGQYGSVVSSSFDGVIARAYFIDGLALDPTSFAGFNANKVWTPKLYAGIYGTNGSFLSFEDNSAATAATLGKDSSSNGNNYTPVNFSITTRTSDTFIDVPNNYDDGGLGRGNYATFNPLDNGSAVTLSEANLRRVGTTSGGISKSSMVMSSGKWYAEFYSNSAINMFGIVPDTTSPEVTHIGLPPLAYAYYYNGRRYNNGASTTYGVTFTTADTIGVAFDADAGTVTFYKNGVSQGVAFTGITGRYVFASGDNSATDCLANFGQRISSYPIPAGFKMLNTQNLPDPSIPDPSKYHNVLIYSATAGAQSITGMGFQSDFLHFKARNIARNNCEFDSPRGPTKALHSNLTTAETTDTDALASFDADGFSLLPYVSGTSAINTAGDLMSVAGWKKGVVPGFDIVLYTGTGAARTIAHGLGAVPAMMIVRSRTGARNWNLWNKAMTASQFLLWNLSNVLAADATKWNATLPTSSVFSVGASAETNQTGENYVGLLWSEIEGYSKFGTFTGNGLTSGTFVYCGFKPKFLMIKVNDQAYPWIIYDTARNTFNPVYNKLSPSNNSVENDPNTLGDASQNIVDFVSNGFKMRTSNGNSNNSGSAISFMAFAENPFKTTGAR